MRLFGNRPVILHGRPIGLKIIKKSFKKKRDVRYLSPVALDGVKLLKPVGILYLRIWGNMGGYCVWHSIDERKIKGDEKSQTQVYELLTSIVLCHGVLLYNKLVISRFARGGQRGELSSYQPSFLR